MSLYNLKTDQANSVQPSFIISKFDDDLNHESSYQVSLGFCSCPAGRRPSCRHRQMLPLIVDRVDSNWLWNFEASEWVEGPGGEDD